MRKKTFKPRVSIHVSPEGHAAVFVTWPPGGASPSYTARLTRTLAARGLRIIGVSSATEPAPAAPAGMERRPLDPDSSLTASTSLRPIVGTEWSSRRS